MALEHSYFQSFACQHFGQVQAIVISAVAVKLQDRFRKIVWEGDKQVMLERRHKSAGDQPEQSQGNRTTSREGKDGKQP
jgi:hypothetical protein